MTDTHGQQTGPKTTKKRHKTTSDTQGHAQKHTETLAGVGTDRDANNVKSTTTTDPDQKKNDDVKSSF